MTGMAPSPKGWTTLAWQSDYGQFYLVDREDEAFEAPVEITAEMEARCLHRHAFGYYHLHAVLPPTAHPDRHL